MFRRSPGNPIEVHASGLRTVSTNLWSRSRTVAAGQSYEGIKGAGSFNSVQ